MIRFSRSGRRPRNVGFWITAVSGKGAQVRWTCSRDSIWDRGFSGGNLSSAFSESAWVSPKLVTENKTATTNTMAWSPNELVHSSSLDLRAGNKLPFTAGWDYLELRDRFALDRVVPPFIRPKGTR